MNDIDYIDEDEDPTLPAPLYLLLALLMLAIPIVGVLGVVAVLWGGV